MKNLMVAIALLAAITASAQRGQGRDFRHDLSAEELATLKTKKMTLALALDEKQSDKIYNIVLDQEKDRKANRDQRKAQSERPKLTKEQKLEKANAFLDKHIAVQNKMKSVLTEAQFEEFRKLENRRIKRSRKHNRRGDRHARRYGRK